MVFYSGPEYYSHNSYYKYILTVIDVFSKVAYAVPLKTKQTTEVAAAFDSIIADMPITPRKLMVDAGTEFSGASNAIYNVIVKKYKVDILVNGDYTITPILDGHICTYRQRHQGRGC